MDKYRKYEIAAVICVAIFIVCFSLCLLVSNRSVYSLCYDKYYEDLTEIYGDNIGDKALAPLEAKQNYEQIADGFSSFFKSDYSGVSYKLSERNVKLLNRLKGYYRFAWIASIISLAGAVYSFINLAKRRNYMPLLTGGFAAACLTVFHAVVIGVSKGSTLSGIKNMIMYGDYSYFPDADVLVWCMPPKFGMSLALLYLGIVFGMILLAALIRRIIAFWGRPHKF
ncbi:MAG: hypothetical protein NC240_05595 [Clostridium sp.]|nr:hypothetical protein [Clostridium sp.]